MSAPVFFRAPRGRVEHHAHRDSTGAWVTACGKPARLGARWVAAERGSDPVIRPLCETCRAALTQVTS